MRNCASGNPYSQQWLWIPDLLAQRKIAKTILAQGSQSGMTRAVPKLPQMNKAGIAPGFLFCAPAFNAVTKAAPLC
jgi:hypothetical protein